VIDRDGEVFDRIDDLEARIKALTTERDLARAERDAYRYALEDAGASNECCEDRLGDLKSDVQRRLTVIELASRTP
jgi:hypothetical protein